jgi:hypothetical protein
VERERGCVQHELTLARGRLPGAEKEVTVYKLLGAVLVAALAADFIWVISTALNAH